MSVKITRLLRVDEREDGAAWAAALQAPGWWPGSTMLKQEGDSWVRRATIMGRAVVVKCRGLRSPSRRFKAAIGAGHAHKHWRGAARLASAGVRTAKPYVAALAQVDDAPAELLVLEYLEGESVLHLLKRAHSRGGPGVRVQHAVARAVGATIPALLRARWHNRDHKPSNIIVTDASDSGAAVAVIDCVGIHRYGWMGIDECEGEEMAAALMIEPIGCECPPRRSLWMRALLSAMGQDVKVGTAARANRHADLRVLIEEVQALIDAHGDPRPRVNPLTGAQGTAPE